MADNFGLNDGSSLAARQVSGFPLSLPTCLALESIFPKRLPAYDPDRKIPQTVNIGDYKECWISLSTLFRNMVNSVTTDTARVASPMDFKDALETEIDVINGLFMNEGNNLCKPMFYICSYKGLKSSIPKQITLREDKTEGQKQYTTKHDLVMKLLSRNNDEVFDFDSEVKPKSKSNALMLTHRPWDLLSYKNFTKLDLLESNTGRLKSRYLWNTKYYPVGDSDLSVIPFSKRLLLLFGDRVQIHPTDMKLRRLIIETAVKNKWTPMTSESKVLLDLQGAIMEPYILKLINSL